MGEMDFAESLTLDMSHNGLGLEHERCASQGTFYLQKEASCKFLILRLVLSIPANCNQICLAKLHIFLPPMPQSCVGHASVR